MKRINFVSKCCTMTIVALFTLCVCVNAQSNDNYGDAVMELMAITHEDEEISQATEHLPQFLNAINEELLAPSSKGKGNMLAEKYIKENAEQKLLRPILVNMLKDQISIEDIRKITETMKSEEGQTYIKHTKVMETKMEAEIDKFMGDDVTENPSKLKPVEYTCPEDFAKRFDVFYENSSMKKGIDATLKILEMSAMMSESQVEKNNIQAVMDYIKKYYVVIAANSAYGTITDQDIEFSKKLSALPSYSIDVQNLISGSVQTIMEFSESYKQWLKTQNVELKK